MSATSTTDLEPLSDHGAAARVRHLREHLPLDPLNSWLSAPAGKFYVFDLENDALNSHHSINKSHLGSGGRCHVTSHAGRSKLDSFLLLFQ